MTPPEVKQSGTRAPTVKRPAPQSPANVRPVSPMKGTQNPQHTHAVIVIRQGAHVALNTVRAYVAYWWR